jgi:hypothetical protein
MKHMGVINKKWQIKNLLLCLVFASTLFADHGKVHRFYEVLIAAQEGAQVELGPETLTGFGKSATLTQDWRNRTKPT